MDDTGRKYLSLVVDGGKRMQQLINDLLEYSKVGRRGTAFKLQRLSVAVEEARSLLQFAIVESGTTFEVGDLPELAVDLGQMVRFFQNLIGNAVKYRKDQPPHVRIWSERAGNCWDIYVRDNGIGIAREFAEQVFVIFKRLHTREEYSGTGIGLAVCRRIVERHGGKIQLVYDEMTDSGLQCGSLFRITLPVQPPESDVV